VSGWIVVQVLRVTSIGVEILIWRRYYDPKHRGLHGDFSHPLTSLELWSKKISAGTK
jgi:hypothetical protein